MFYITIIILILIIYIYSYYIYTKNIIILQTTLNDFSFDLLYKKQPIVIEDRIVDINIILKNWFNLNIIYSNNLISNDFLINNSKFLLIYSLEDEEIIISPPNKTNDNIIAIKLYKNQSLILPFKWHYYKEKNNFLIYEIHDYITYLLLLFTSNRR